MRDVDQLVRALREEADRVPQQSLLPAVLSGARQVRRRRRVAAGVAGVAGITAAVVIGVSVHAHQVSPAVNPQPSPTTTAPPTAGLYGLAGRTFYLVSFTRDFRTEVPGTGRTPTLVFDNAGKATTDDGSNVTQWQVNVDAQTISWAEGSSTQAPESSASFDVQAATVSVLSARTTWILGADRLTLRLGDDALVYSVHKPTPAVASGGVRLRLQTVHGAGVKAAGSGPVAGQVTITDADGQLVWQAQMAVPGGVHNGLAAGRYTLGATIANGSCASRTVTVNPGVTTDATLSCRDGRSTD